VWYVVYEKCVVLHFDSVHRLECRAISAAAAEFSCYCAVSRGQSAELAVSCGKCEAKRKKQLKYLSPSQMYEIEFVSVAVETVAAPGDSAAATRNLSSHIDLHTHAGSALDNRVTSNL